MNKYELALVVSAKLDNEGVAAVVDNAKQLIERFGGQVSEVEEWGKRKLAYEIQKQTEAFYFFVQFEADTTAPAEIESRMRIMENVLRYLVIRKDENDTFKVTPEKAPAAETAEEAEAEEAVEEAPEAPEVPAEEAETEE
ncbi:MAG: 30S ribosomal protein S6 [Lachnospiraceae bacterium]|nr:30S ribosomal protein S6 [Lachnospiraceae bacterium]